MFYDRTGSYLTYREFDKIKEKFVVKNLKKIQAMNMKLWGWQKLPTKIKHYEVIASKKLVKIPNWLRGFFPFEDRYWEVVNVKHPKIYNEYEWNELDTMQNTALNSLLVKNVWFGHFSTAIWKTMITAKIIDRLQVKTLILVPNLTLMNQMKTDLKEIFGVTCKTLSWTKTKQKWAYDDILIWNIDTMVKQDREFIEQFELIIIDELDTTWLQAEKRLAFTGSLAAKYIYWMTWTIQLNHVSDKVFPLYLWPKSELLLKNFTPKIFKVLTDFEYILDDLKDFHLLKEALYTNPARNNLILNTIHKNLWNRKWLVFCEYIDHAKLIDEQMSLCWIKTFLLIWEIKKDERERIKKELKEWEWPCLLIGSVKIIGRWFNVPELSIWFLTTAEKFRNNIEQYVGRVIRKFDWKTDCIWYDFVDVWAKILLGQANSRSTTYRREFKGCNITLI